MDLTKIANMAGDVVEKLDDVKNVPGVAGAVDAAQKAVGQVQAVVDQAQAAVGNVQAKAQAVGLGGMVDNAINAAEKKIGVDIDGDRDKGVAQGK